MCKIKSLTAVFFIVLCMACKKENNNGPAPKTNNGEDGIYSYNESIVNDNSNFKTVATVSAGYQLSQMKLSEISSGMYNKNFKVKITAAVYSDQWRTSTYIKFDSDANGMSKETFILEDGARNDRTTPSYYKDPDNTNEYFNITNGAVSRSTVEPFLSGEIIKNTDYYKRSNDNYLLRMSTENMDFTSDFALCGTDQKEVNALIYSPAGLGTGKTYFYLASQADFHPDDFCGYSAGKGFFNAQNEPRYIGVHYTIEDFDKSIKIKCNYPTDVNNTSDKAKYYSGPEPIKTMELENEMLISSDLGSALPKGTRIKPLKTLKAGNELLVFIDFYESKKICLVKYNFVSKAFNSLIPIMDYPTGFNPDNVAISPNGNFYYMTSSDVYLVKNSQSTSIHNSSLFKETNTSYHSIAMKQDKLLIFVYQSNFINAKGNLDYRISTLLANTSF